MTLNQVINEITTICEGHAMIKEVKYVTPIEWLNKEGVPNFPLVNFSIDSGNYNQGRELVYRINLWLLDKSGQEGEFETEVISDMHKIGGDITNAMRQQFKSYSISNASWIAISEKFEDYLSGVKLTFDLSAQNMVDACNIPVL